MTKEEADPDTSLITGIISISGVKARTFIDSGAKLFFISESFIRTLGITYEKTEYPFDVLLPSGQELQTT